MNLARAIAPFALALMLLPSAAHAAPGTMKVGGDDLLLNGSGTRKATIFKVKVYVGSLYLKEKQTDSAAVLAQPQPYAVRMSFVRDVSKEDLAEAVKKGVAKNSPTKATFETSGKTTVLLGGKKLGSISSDPGFGPALLSAWIGPKPPNKGLKKGMLGG